MIFPPPSAWRRLLSGLIPYDADAPAAGRYRARQIHAVLRFTPLAILANALNVMLVLWGTWESGPQPFLLGWAAMVLAMAGRGMVIWLRQFRFGPRASASARALHRATLGASLLAVVWAALPVAVFPSAGPEQQLLLATVVTGMMCAGGFALATVPTAGIAYVLVLGAGAATALALSDLRLAPVIGGLLVVYCGIVVASVLSTARLFGARLVAEAEAERQNEVIGLLLRDFEENASDLLWEVGPDRCLRHVSPRMAEMLGLPAQVLLGTPVLELLARMLPDDEQAQTHFEALRAHLSTGQPFRDLSLPMTHSGRKRWWSLSAKPLLDARGQADGWRGVAADITAARQASERLSWLAHNDPLTGLANRHLFRSQLADWLDAGSSAPTFALLCLDLDHFKSVNDTLGHASGDALLRVAAQRLGSITRPGDLVARLGGDEFAVLLAVCTADEATHCAQRLLTALRTPCEVNGVQVSTHASIGIAFAPNDGSDPDTLFSHADLALYAAKADGRNALRLFELPMAAATRRRVALEQALNGALTRGELRLVYQPQASISGEHITGFEALLRWTHPELGEVTPTEFVPVAEEAGMMPAIGDWVLADACRTAASWPQHLCLSVNVSPAQTLDTGLVGRVLRHAQDAGLKPQRLQLEITESMLLNESAATLDALRTLRARGVRLALDDFGTGYSALAYLRRFPLDTLKIDRSFMRELTSGSQARAIVRMILTLARTLGMDTVAEGVEHAEHAAVLQRYGCETMQGYLVARPMPADAVQPFLAGWRGLPDGALPEPTATDMLPL